MSVKEFDLRDRFEDFATSILFLFKIHPQSFSGDYLAKQLIRSACSAALNFAEFEGAGSKKDKANKLRISLKELRESFTNLNILKKAEIIKSNNIQSIRQENEELIRIVVSMIKKYEE